MSTQITALKSEQRVLTQALSTANELLAFDQGAYNDALTKHTQLTTDYETFHSELFAAADLPAEPGRYACNRYTAAFRRTSFSCSKNQFRFHNSRTSTDSARVRPGLAPSSTTAQLNHLCSSIR